MGLNFWVTTFTWLPILKTKKRVHYRLYIVVNDNFILIIGGRLLVEYEIQKEDLQIRSENGISRAVCKVLKYWVFKTTGQYFSMTNNNNQYLFLDNLYRLYFVVEWSSMSQIRSYKRFSWFLSDICPFSLKSPTLLTE